MLNVSSFFAHFYIIKDDLEELIMKKIYEIILSKDEIEQSDWEELFMEVSKINGLMNTWRFYVIIEKNVFRYFVESDYDLPPILSFSDGFFLKEENNCVRVKKLFYKLYYVTNAEEKISDIYDINESKHNQILKQVEIKVKLITPTRYFTKTFLYLYKGNKLKKFKTLLFISTTQLAENFSENTRFICKKTSRKYLEISKCVEVFSEQKQSNTLLQIDGFPYYRNNYYLNMDKFDFDKHSLIVGASGCGKTKFIATFINNIYANYKDDYKIIMIDPHGAIIDELQNMKDMRLVDMKTQSTSIDLMLNSRELCNTNTEILIEIFKDLFGKEYNSKLERVLRHSIYLLLKLEMLTFSNLRRLITQVEYRNRIIRNANNVEVHVKEFFAVDFNELKNQFYSEAISPIVSLIDEIQMLPGFSGLEGAAITNNINSIVANNFLTLFSLNQSELGDKVVKIISSLAMGEIFQLCQRRSYSQKILLIIDEVAIVQNPILTKLLAEARKYNLSVFVAGQYLYQLKEELRQAIFSNVMNYYCFRIAREDARFMSGTLQMEMAVKNSFFNKIKLLSQLSNRELVIRTSIDGRVIPAFKGRTLDYNVEAGQPKEELFETNDFTLKEEPDVIEEFDFSIGDVKNVTDIMKNLSTGRKENEF